jgi:hypothetical protein
MEKNVKQINSEFMIISCGCLENLLPSNVESIPNNKSDTNIHKDEIYCSHKAKQNKSRREASERTGATSFFSGPKYFENFGDLKRLDAINFDVLPIASL